MKKITLICFSLILLYASCENSVHPVSGPFQPKKYPADLAVEWNKLQMKISRTTAGYGPGPATRAFAYSGLTFYEALVGGMPGYRSVASFMTGTGMPGQNGAIHWPASANAAMASIVKDLIPTASDASKARIDSLEQVFNTLFGQEKHVTPEILQNSIDFGRSVADVIFEWSKSDGFAEAQAANNSYVIPVGTGLWEKTPPAFAFPINVYLGKVRTFAPNAAELTMPPKPVTYSEGSGSPFYNQVNEVYTISQSLTDYDKLTSKTWGEFPGNFTNGLRYLQLAILLIDDSKLNLDQAALAFAKHGMALQDATIAVFKAKYTYNVVRPITYIRNVMGYTGWNTFNTTPPHPEYPAAHAVGGRASSRALEGIFGKNYGFTDRTHESLYGARHYDNLEAYSIESGWSRVLGGIHYVQSVNAGAEQGEEVADLINQLPFKASSSEH